jgi:Holliday junction resolvase RusA-like endonuclease
MAEWEALIPSLEKCRVDVTWFVNTRTRRDTDNLAPLLKAIYDGLGSDTGVSARIVPDDAPAFMEKPEATIIFDKKCKPHFRVTITELTR